MTDKLIPSSFAIRLFRKVHTGTARESWRVRNKRCKSKCWSASAKFLSFPAESKNEDGGQKSKPCQKFFQSPEPGLHRVSYTKMSGVLSDQTEEGLNLTKPFGTESTQLQ